MDDAIHAEGKSSQTPMVMNQTKLQIMMIAIVLKFSKLRSKFIFLDLLRNIFVRIFFFLNETVKDVLKCVLPAGLLDSAENGISDCIFYMDKRLE